MVSVAAEDNYASLIAQVLFNELNGLGFGEGTGLFGPDQGMAVLYAADGIDSLAGEFGVDIQDLPDVKRFVAYAHGDFFGGAAGEEDEEAENGEGFGEVHLIH